MRTPSEHKIDTFSLREDGRKDTRDGMDSLNYVDFVGRVEGKALGTGKSYYVLPSHPTRVRGLKRVDILSPPLIRIAPHAGARIETTLLPRNTRSSNIAPHAGARIETNTKETTCTD